jgi:hypothetical protein
MKKLRREYAARMVIATSFVSLAASLVALLALLPAEVAVQIENRTLGNLEANAPSTQQASSDSSALSRTESELGVLSPYLATSSPALEAMRAVLSDKPTGTSIISRT